MTRPRRTDGFSLLELAVVLAIIGLLAGGVLATQGYIRSSQIVTTVNESRSMLNAMKQFERNYGGAIAGDMSNATSYWGDGGGCPNTIATGTCNGNGNGLIYYNSGNGYVEIFLAFQHLKLAGLIQGNYTGLTGAAGTSAPEIGNNVPAFSTSGVTGYFKSVSGDGYNSGGGVYYDGFYGPYMLTVGKVTSANAFPASAWLSAAEAFELDSKFDNGVPSTGWIRTRMNIAACVSSATAYAVSSTPDSCIFYLTPAA